MSNDVKQQVTAAADQAQANLKNAAAKEVAGVKGRLVAVDSRFQAFLASHPKKLIFIAAVLALLVGLFFGAVAGVQLARVDVQSVQSSSGLTAEDVGVSPVSAQPEGWHEFVPQFRPAWGNG